MSVELLCLLVVDFELQVMRRGKRGACVLATRVEAGARVLAVDPVLADVGVRPGQTLAQARSRVCLMEGRLGGAVEIEVLVPRPELIAREMDELLEELHAVAPGLHVEGPGLVFIDPRDLRWLEPDEARLAARLVAVARGRGLEARVGLGPGRLVARLTAERGGAGLPRTTDAGAFLAPVPLETVGLDRRTREAMGVLGLRTLGDLARLSERQVVDRWGVGATGAWRLARGEDDWAGVRWRPEARHESVVEVGGAREADALGFALAAPLEGLLEAARRRGERPESLIVDLAPEREGEPVHRLVLSVDRGAPLPTGASLLALLRLELEREGRDGEIAFTLGVARARLTLGRAPAALGAIADLSGELGGDRPEESLFERRRDGGEPLRVTLARLRARLGGQGVGRARLRSALRPEGGWRWRGLGEPEGDGRAGWGTDRPSWRPPIWELLPLPEGTALRLTPGGPREVAEPDPAAVLTGPCTLSSEWWNDQFVRDYYLVADGRAARARLVFFDRLGGRWYVQGDVD